MTSFFMSNKKFIDVDLLKFYAKPIIFNILSIIFNKWRIFLCFCVIVHVTGYLLQIHGSFIT